MITKAWQTALIIVQASLGGNKVISDVLKMIKVELDVDTQSARLISSNLEQTSMCTVTYVGNQNAEFLIDGSLIKAFLKFKDPTFSLEFSAGLLVISCGKVHLELTTASSAGFPELGRLHDAEWSRPLSTWYIEESIGAVAHCASRDKSRPTLQGIRFIKGIDGECTSCSTDGHRMSVNVVPDSPMPDMLLPVASLKAISRSIKGASSVSVCQGVDSDKEDSALFLSASNRVFGLKGAINLEVENDDAEDSDEEIEFLHVFRLLEAHAYPDVAGLISTMREHKGINVEVSLAPVKDAVIIANVFDGEFHRCVISFDETRAIVSSHQAKRGRAELSFDIIGEIDPRLKDVQLGVSGKYLLDALGSCLGGTATLRIPLTERGPLHIKSDAKEDLIMPMRM